MTRRTMMISAAALLAAAAVSCAGTGGAAKTERVYPRPGTDETKLTLYVVRHGQTILNLMDRVQGWSDGTLTVKGVDGAVNMGKGLRDVYFDAVYSSDLARAAETARYAMEQNKATPVWKVEQLPELREVCFGIFEGDPNADMYKALAADIGVEVDQSATSMGKVIGPIIGYYQGSMLAFTEGLANFNKKVDTQYKIAESPDEIYGRLQAGLDKIIAENPRGGNVMMVAHGQAIMFALAQMGVDLALLPPSGLGNSSVTKIVYDYAARTYTIDGPVGDLSYMEAGAKLK